jgi:hypothetical protein
MESKYQTVRDYIAARKRGDRATTDRIVKEVTDRYNTRTTDGSELGDLMEANQTIPFRGQ